MLFSACQISYAADHVWSGAGTKEDPYRIGGYSELCALSHAVKDGENFSGEYFCLTSDIDLSADWVPVGALKEGASGADNGRNINPFSGTLNGSGFTVTSAEGGKSLFGYVRGAVITDLNISGKNISGNGLINNYVVDYGPTGSGSGVHTATVQRVTIKSGTTINGSGIVGGYSSGGNTVDILDCVIEESVVIGYDRSREKIGSFGGDFSGTVTRSRSAATVYGTNYVGGIVGCKNNSMSGTNVTGCTFSGKVIASGQNAGGIAGGGYGGTRWGINTAPNAIPISIQSCLCSGEVTASDIAGGILGYETTAQPWNEGYIRANIFTGTVNTTDGTCRGALVGAYRGMDKLDIVSNNYYYTDCGTNRGIGKVTYLDTSCATHETTYGKNYFDSSSGNIPVYEGLNDVYPGNLKPDYNRTDDPLGADAYKLAKPVTAEELADGTVTALLNSASGSLKNWVQGEHAPEIKEDSAEAIATSISIISPYKVGYEIGDSLETDNLKFIIRWSDGTESTVYGNHEGLSILGFDSSKAGSLILTAVFEGVRTTFNVKIKDPAGSGDQEQIIKVTFKVLGDDRHGVLDQDNAHARSRNNLTLWIPETEISVPYESTAAYVIQTVLLDYGLEIRGNTQNPFGFYYLSGVQIPGTDTILYEKDNGPNSGWMYAVNDVEPQLGLGEYVLEDGDELLLFYSDDYSLEQYEMDGDDPSDGDEDDPSGGDKDDSSGGSDEKDDPSGGDKDDPSGGSDEKDDPSGGDKDDPSGGSDDKDDPSGGDKDDPSGGSDDKDKPSGGDQQKPNKPDDKTPSGGDEVDPEVAIVKGRTYTVDKSKYKVIKVASGRICGKVALVKAANRKTASGPKWVRLTDGKLYKITQINAKAYTGKKIKTVVIGESVRKIKKNAFRSSKAVKLIILTKNLKKASVKGSLKGSKIKNVKIKIGSKKVNRKYVKKYRKIFTRKNAGKKVTVR